MSATVTDDSFLVKGLGLDAAVIKSPLAYEDEKWTGEKMILIPSLIDRPLAQAHIERIRSWLGGFETSQDMLVSVDDVLGSLVWGGDSDKFEAGMDKVGSILGFATRRPDKEWKEGPDNLWCLRDNAYLLFEDKNKVSLTRAEITKYETEQMDTSSAWFANVYPDAKVTRVMVIPTKKVSGAAAFHPEFDAVIIDVHGGASSLAASGASIHATTL